MRPTRTITSAKGAYIRVHRIEKTLLGKSEVHHQCPHCGSDLVSPLDDAGKSFPCPTCRRTFVTPGAAELQQWRAEEAAKDAKRAEAAKRRETMEAAEAGAKASRRQAEERRAREAELEYPAIMTGARLLTFFSWVIGIIGAMAIASVVVIAVIGAGSAAREPLDSRDKMLLVPAVAALFFGGAGCLATAVFLNMQASLALAVRDIARNSFRH